MMIAEQPIKKVLMTADPVGGVWTYALDLCRAFSALNIQVCLATMGCHVSATQRQEAARIPGLDLRESEYKLEWMDDPWDDVALAGAWLLDLEKEVEPDIIHLNGYMHAKMEWQAPVVVVAHSCVLSWWQGVKHEPAPAEWNKYKTRVAEGLRAADRVVSISNTYAAELNQLYGRVENMSVIYNGRNMNDFHAAKKKQQVFAMGRIWDEAKNLSILSRISNHARLPVFIAGDNVDPGTGAVVEIENVRLLGKLSQPEVRAYLADSCFFVLPAKYEPFGLSALEAALSGCLLLLAENPTLKELWQDTALYFDPDKPEEIDRLLDDLNNHPEKITCLVERSLARAKSFSLEQMVAKYLELYQGLVSKKLLLNQKTENI